MADIRILPDHLINQIAAGEVIERPASIVKELVENAIDAGATRIEIDITAGGLEGIEIRDNGHGMEPDNLRLSVVRHATSKISSEEDLFGIMSLGFRGEALPSIASVSRLRIKSRPQGSDQGLELNVAHGLESGEQVVGMPYGTVVTVTELFRNVPARLKFLGSARAEAARITALFQKMALSHPEISFHYFRDGRAIVHTGGDGRLINAVAALFSAETARSLLKVDFSYHEYRVEGFVSKPSYGKASRKQEFIFLNRRVIEDATVRHALESAYGQMLNHRRFPVAFLYLTVPAGDVDVNVHPAKREVRFTQKRDIHSLVYGAVREALNDWQDARTEDAPGIPASGPARSEFSAPEYEARRIPHFETAVRESTPVFQMDNRTPVKQEKTPFSVPAPEYMRSPEVSTESPRNVSVPEEFSQIMVLGQIHDSFIVLQNRRGMVVIDQHAAHERIIVDKLRRRSEGTAIQYFAVPLTLSFGNAVFSTIEDYLPEINRLGLIAEPFGANSIIVRGIPEFLAGKLSMDEIKEIFSDVFGGAERLAEWYDNILIGISCKAAIKINQPLNRSEIIGLIGDLARAENWRFCPHGRPTVWEVPYGELERIFKRV